MQTGTGFDRKDQVAADGGSPRRVSCYGNGLRLQLVVKRVSYRLFPVAIVAHDFIDSACANFIANGTQFSTVGKDGIFERGLFVVVPFAISITTFCALPLEQYTGQVSGDNECKRVQ